MFCVLALNQPLLGLAFKAFFEIDIKLHLL